MIKFVLNSPELLIQLISSCLIKQKWRSETQIVSLTARPLAESRFLFCKVCFFNRAVLNLLVVYSLLFCRWPDADLRSAKSWSRVWITQPVMVCNVYSAKAFETLIHETVTLIVFFIECKIYFFWFYRSVRCKERFRRGSQCG